MESEGHLFGNFAREAPYRCDMGLQSSLVRVSLHVAMDCGNFPCAIPLDREILVRNGVEDRIQFGSDRLLIAGPDARQVPGHGEGRRPDHAVEHRHRDLKAQILRQYSLLAQSLEHEVRAGRVLGIAETVTRIAEADLLDAVLDPELPDLVPAARHELLDAVDALRPF